MKKFAEKLKELRRERNWTQKELAKRLVITRASVASWETNRAEPSLATLCRIALVFGETTDCLLCVDANRLKEDKNNATLLDIDL